MSKCDCNDGFLGIMQVPEHLLDKSKWSISIRPIKWLSIFIICEKCERGSWVKKKLTLESLLRDKKIIVKKESEIVFKYPIRSADLKKEIRKL